MFRQLALRQSTILRNQARTLTTSPARYSVIDTAKDVLLKANKKTGEVLAGSMEKAEQVTPNADSVSDAASKVNKKTGEVLAEGMEKAQQKAPNVESVGDAASKLNKKTGEVLADGMEKTEKYVPNTAGEAKQKGGEVLTEGKEKGEEILAEGKEKGQHAYHKHRVRENTKGYEGLQDKGSKAEVEQNRPDDAV